VGGLALVSTSAAFAASSNSALSAPVINATGTDQAAGVIQVAESATGGVIGPITMTVLDSARAATIQVHAAPRLVVSNGDTGAVAGPCALIALNEASCSITRPRSETPAVYQIIDIFYDTSSTATGMVGVTVGGTGVTAGVVNNAKVAGPASITISPPVPPSVQIGRSAQAAARIVITNGGTAVADGDVITITLPSATTYTTAPSMTVTQGACVLSSATDSVAPSQTASWTLSAGGPACGFMTSALNLTLATTVPTGPLAFVVGQSDSHGASGPIVAAMAVLPAVAGASLAAESTPSVLKGKSSQGPAGNLDLAEAAGGPGALGGTFTLTAADSAGAAINFSSTPQAAVTAGDCALSAATGLTFLNTVKFTVARSSASPCSIRITNIFYKTNTVAQGNALGSVTVTATGGGVDTSCPGSPCNNQAVNARIVLAGASGDTVSVQGNPYFAPGRTSTAAGTVYLKERSAGDFARGDVLTVEITPNASFGGFVETWDPTAVPKLSTSCASSAHSACGAGTFMGYTQESTVANFSVQIATTSSATWAIWGLDVNVAPNAPAGPISVLTAETGGGNPQTIGWVQLGTVGTPPSLLDAPVMAAPVVSTTTITYSWSGLSIYSGYPPNTFSYGLEIVGPNAFPAIENNAGPDPNRIYAAATQSLTGANGSTSVSGTDATFRLTAGAAYTARAISWSDWEPIFRQFTLAAFVGVFASSVPFVAR
jgi:hypothetical protein